MIIFVPFGDASGTDDTRKVSFYNEIAAYLEKCGAEPLIDS
jgi:hypothetical protein